MKVKELIERFDLQLVAGEKGIDRDVRGGYCGDLLSDVMAHAPIGCIWLTVQGHLNIVAVAILREMAAIVITGGREPESATIQKAEEEGLPILTARRSAFELAGRFFAAGADSASAV